MNTIEKLYIGLLVTVFALGILSLFRLIYFKNELRKVFDSRSGFTRSPLYWSSDVFTLWPEVEKLVNLEKRLQWYGIQPLEKDFKGLYAKDCNCEFNPELDFKCKCGWNKKITIAEHEKFQDLRIVSKPGIILASWHLPKVASDVGDIVMLVTSSCRWLKDGANFEKLVTEFRCWRYLMNNGGRR